MHRTFCYKYIAMKSIDVMKYLKNYISSKGCNLNVSENNGVLIVIQLLSKVGVHIRHTITRGVGGGMPPWEK